MQINLWKKFRISVNSASFLYHLIEFAVKYKKKNILKILSRCLRDSALQWLENQFKFISLNDFKTIITKIFLFSSISEINLNQTIIDSSSQKYHRCLECDAQFSSISRFLTHAQKSCNKVYTCKHCEKIFTSNNKFHEHVRLHHIKKSYSNKTLKQRFVEEKNSHIDLLNSFILSITFKSMTASTKSSHLFIFMTKTQIARSIEFSVDSSISSMNLIVLIAASKSSHSHRHTRMSFTFSLSSIQTSRLKHQKQHRKLYFIMNDLFEMFAEISSKKSKNIMQKKSTSSCFSESRQTRIKSLCQQNSKDTAMLAKRQFRRNLNAIRKRMRFSLFSMSDQIQITNYFKFVDQSNFTSIKSINSRKFSLFINNLNSTSRICFSVNQDARTSHIAFETNFTSSSLETQ